MYGSQSPMTDCHTFVSYIRVFQMFPPLTQASPFSAQGSLLSTQNSPYPTQDSPYLHRTALIILKTAPILHSNPFPSNNKGGRRRSFPVKFTGGKHTVVRRISDIPGQGQHSHNDQ